MSARRQRLAALGRRTRQVVLLSAVTGFRTGSAVALFEWVTHHQLFERVADAPTAVQVGGPLVGLLGAARRVPRSRLPVIG